ncbi:MAG: T9SS type A sorting domain-containing protein [Candidatus Poribacteria bacterium]|nr:T9SS type A sorting domain-containing protein [Candidatus Poribacteria bacterium]
MKMLIVNGKSLVLILTIVLMGTFGTQNSYGQTITASTPEPLTEANLHDSIVTLILSGGLYEKSIFTIERAVNVSGIPGVTIGTRQGGVKRFGIKRVSDTQLTVQLQFFDNIDTDIPLVFTVEAGAIVGYNGNALTTTLPVIALEESLDASTEAPLTEATLHESTITLTLTGRRFADESDIGRAVSVSGIDGVSIAVRGFIFTQWDVDRVSDTVATVTLAFSGNINTDATLTLTIGADAIINYDKDFTFQFPVTAIEESLDASTTFPLTEATLHESVVTLTLNGYRFAEWGIENALSISGIDGVTVSGSYFGVDRISDTQVTVGLQFDGTDFNTDAVLTFTVDAHAIIGSDYGLTAQVPVTAIQKSNATVSIAPSPVIPPAVEERLTFSLNIAGGENVAGYQATVLFDDSALEYIESANGDYLPADAFFAAPVVDDNWIEGTFFDEERWEGSVTIAANTLAGAANGDGALATLTFKGVDFKASQLTLSQFYLVDTAGKLWEAHTENAEITLPPEPAEAILGDINRDGVVNIQDLIIVGARYGQRGQNDADLNGDGLVDIVDLVLVANAFEADAAAPSLNPQILEQLTAADVKNWLTQAQHLSLTDPAHLRGITVLEQLLMALTPKETALLANYPNPFNPETWIPYHLAKDAEVTLHIYAVNGTLVRTLTLGHQPAGMYQNRSRAAYWDGKNEFGESVASGVYFYTFIAGDFTATRKMLIRK